MDYSTILFKFRSCMEEIGEALRDVLGTNDKYKFTEIASSIKTCAQVFYLGEGMSFDVSHIPGYQNFTVDNFVAMPLTGHNSDNFNVADSKRGTSCSLNRTFSYDSTTGIYKCSYSASGGVHESSGGNHGISVSVASDVYLVIGKVKTL